MSLSTTRTKGAFSQVWDAHRSGLSKGVVVQLQVGATRSSRYFRQPDRARGWDRIKSRLWAQFRESLLSTIAVQTDF
jgi:hypothetical protein